MQTLMTISPIVEGWIYLVAGLLIIFGVVAFCFMIASGMRDEHFEEMRRKTDEKRGEKLAEYLGNMAENDER